jgi:hypothetical protein
MEDKCDLNLKLYYKFVNIHRMRKHINLGLEELVY